MIARPNNPGSVDLIPGPTKTLLALLGAMLLSLLQACGAEKAPTEDAEAIPEKMPEKIVEAGSVAPPWSGTDLSTGGTIEFPAVLAGKPAVMVFWATWCPYCKAFMPYNEQILEDYAEHGVQILTFNAKERGEGDPAAYVASLGFPTTSIADADGIAADYDVEFIPGLFVVDGDANVVYRRGWTDLPAGKTVAQQWDEEVRAALDATLGLNQPGV